MEGITGEAHLWKETQSGTDEDTFLRNPTGWTDNLEEGNKGEGLGIAIAGSSIMVFSLSANIFVIATITSKIRGQERVSSVYFLVRHLAAAGLLVSCLFLPVEMRWMGMDNFSHWTSWLAQDVICRLMTVLSNFGVYSTAFIVICVTLDRCLAVMRPLQAYRSVRRARKMAIVAWTASGVCSGAFEGIVYHLENDDLAPWKKHCTPTGLWGSREAELAYFSLKGILVLGVPCATILVCYSCMFWKLWKLYSDCVRYNVGLNLLRSANTTTLKLSLAIALLFIICWAPYNVIIFWTVVDHRFHFKVNPMVPVVLRLTACANSCLNSIVYLYYYFRE